MPHSRKSTLSLVTATCLVLLAGCSDDKPSAQVAAGNQDQAAAVAAAVSQGGEAIWATCASCHGAQGEGQLAQHGREELRRGVRVQHEAHLRQTRTHARTQHASTNRTQQPGRR